jgi:2',3'-cyclic-nucleotide 2'-phosphodiesterase (5'-nucleotidase family)
MPEETLPELPRESVSLSSTERSCAPSAVEHSRRGEPPPGTSKPAHSNKPADLEHEVSHDGGPVLTGNLIKIPIIHTNDLHGAVKNMPLLDKKLHELRSVNPDAILVDSGDAGNTANHTVPDRFEKIVDLFNRHGYTAVVPGNHEFQWGKDVAIDEYFSQLDATVVCANIFDKETGERLKDTVPYFITDMKGVKMGFVGITTTKMATPQHPDMGSDLNALPETETLLTTVKEMRQQGAQVIIALVHKGVNDIREEGKKLTEEEKDLNIQELIDLAVKVPDIDVIAAGHDHKVVNLAFDTGPYPHKTYIVEAGSHGDEVGEIDLFVDPKSKQVVTADMKVYHLKKYVNTPGESPDLQAAMPLTSPECILPLHNA